MSGKNPPILLEKRKSPKYLMVMLKSAPMELIRIKRILIPTSSPQAPKIHAFSRIWRSD
jgi:hypothetical protein